MHKRLFDDRIYPSDYMSEEEIEAELIETIKHAEKFGITQDELFDFYDSLNEAIDNDSDILVIDATNDKKRRSEIFKIITSKKYQKSKKPLHPDSYYIKRGKKFR